MHPALTVSSSKLRLPLGVNLVGLRGMAQQSPERIFHMYVGTTVVTYNKAANAVEILFTASQQVGMPLTLRVTRRAS